MTEQEMLERIKELEEENAKLRERLPTRRTIRPVCPDWIGEKYGGKVLTRGTNIYSLSFVRNSELSELSKIIRRICFPHEERMQKRAGSSSMVKVRGTVKVDDMTDEQYGQYCTVLDEVLSVLSKHISDKSEASE